MPATPPIASVEVGRYRLEVGAAAGTLIAASPSPQGADAASLARALEEPRTTGKVSEEIVDRAEEVTARAEEAVDLFKLLATQQIDPRDVSKRVDLMLEMLGRLDKQGRWEEALRLARALNGVLALLFRWADLVRSLTVVREAAERIHDLSALAWSEHELGTLYLAAGDPAGADRRLAEAQRIRRQIGDAPGLAATEHNLQFLCQQLRQELRDGRSRRGRGRRPLVLALAGLLLLLAGGVAGAIIADDDGGRRAVDAELVVRTEGAGTVRSDPAGIRCPQRCEGAFPRRSRIVLSARPSGGATFAGWSGGGCEGIASCRFRLRRDATVTATFRAAPPGTATLRVLPAANGTVTSDPAGIDCPPTCQQPFSAGTPVVLDHAAANGFGFTEWSGDCTGSECRLTMSSNQTVAAAFAATPTVDVTVRPTGEGSVTSPDGMDCPDDCVATVPAGNPIVLTAVGDFIEWGGACDGTEPPSCTLEPQEDAAVTARFVRNVE